MEFDFSLKIVIASHQTTQNSGVIMSDDDETGQIFFYGELHEIIRLRYICMKEVALFKCELNDTSLRKNRITM